MKRTKYYKEELEKQRTCAFPQKNHITQVCKGMLALCRILEDFCFLTFRMLVFQDTCKTRFSSSLGGCLCFA